MNQAKRNIKIILLGDLNLGGELIPYWYDPGFDPFVNLHEIFNSSDIIFANLENVFYRGPLRPRRSSHLFAPDISVKAIRKAGITVLSLANNHAMDFGSEAMMRTKKLLKQNHIECIGAGMSKEDASEGCIITKNNCKIGFLAYTTSSYHVRSILAGSFSVGCASMKTKSIKSDIKRLKGSADIVCVALHWGYEYMNIPSIMQREFAHNIIKCGADIIIGTHPHVVQGIEIYEGKPIFYSLGNFIFPNFEKLDGSIHKWQKSANKSFIGIVDCSLKKDSNKFNVSYVPIGFFFPFVKKLRGSAKNEFNDRMKSYNSALSDFKNQATIETEIEVKNKNKNWHLSFYKRLIYRLFNEPIKNILGSHRISAIKYRLGK